MINSIKEGIIKNQFLLQIILLLFCFMSNIKSLKIDTNKLNEVLLTQHNKYRKMHGVENLTLDNELIKLAQDYSAVLAYKDYVYANSITTNLKGYITALHEYDNLRIDNEYYEELNKE